MIRLLLARGAEPSAVDHAGFSAWMLVGEAVDCRADDVRECLELLKVKASAEDLLQLAEPERLAATLLSLCKEVTLRPHLRGARCS